MGLECAGEVISGGGEDLPCELLLLLEFEWDEAPEENRTVDEIRPVWARSWGEEGAVLSVAATGSLTVCVCVSLVLILTTDTVLTVTQKQRRG